MIEDWKTEANSKGQQLFNNNLQSSILQRVSLPRSRLEVNSTGNDEPGPYTGDEQIDPIGKSKISNNSSRILRGGSWVNDPQNCRAAVRFWDSPAYRGDNFGFRVCFRLN
jgi:hypothetical protein